MIAVDGGDSDRVGRQLRTRLDQTRRPRPWGLPPPSDLRPDAHLEGFEDQRTEVSVRD